MHCIYLVFIIVQGVIDLVWLPVQQYQEDGRIVWGLQRGTNSFASSSGLAIVELTNRFLYSIQVHTKHNILHSINVLLIIIYFLLSMIYQSTCTCKSTPYN